MTRINRRAVGKLALGGIVGMLLPGTSACAQSPDIEPMSGDRPLRDRAAARGLTFGLAVRPGYLRDPTYAEVVAREAHFVVPENELKWGVTERLRGHPDYSGAEEIASFAKRHKLGLRGHTAFWYGNMPSWAKEAMNGPDAHDVMIRRVSDVVGAFRGRIFEWDVVNEIVEPKDGQSSRLRLAPFGRPIEYQWLANCFHAAHAADPAARLYYNEYFVEGATADEEERRIGVLDFLTAMKRLGAPIDGFGTQSHIAYGRALAPQRYAKFLADVAALGLEIRVTELDVGDYKGSIDVSMRDQQVAHYARGYLDTVLAEPAVRGVTSWGLRDQDSWIQKVIPRKDRAEERPLPWDDDFRRKPLWAAIGQAIDATPKR